MADGAELRAAESGEAAQSEEPGGESGGVPGVDAEGGGLTDAQTELLERCLHSLNHAKNDSHTLAALLLVRPRSQNLTFVTAKTNVRLKYVSVCSLGYVYFSRRFDSVTNPFFISPINT